MEVENKKILTLLSSPVAEPGFERDHFIENLKYHFNFSIMIILVP